MKFHNDLACSYFTMLEKNIFTRPCSSEHLPQWYHW